MAKKGKSKKSDKEDKEKDENLNEGTQEDINEADDTFGLPDIDYKPLEEIEDESDTESEPEPEPAEPEPEIESESETNLEEGNVDEIGEVEETESEESVEEEFVDTDSTDDVFADDEVVDESASGVIPPASRKFEHPKSSSNGPKIIIGILVVIILGAGGYYFGMYKPAMKAEAEKAAIEAKAAEDARIEAERLREEQRRQEELAAAEEIVEEEVVDSGTIRTITEQTNRYYVVIGSFIDVDLATDYGNELAADGQSSMILNPVAERGYYRLALSDHATWADAQAEANQLKGDLGDNLWVLKY